MKNKSAIFIIAFVVLLLTIKVGKSINVEETSGAVYESNATTEAVKYQPDSETLTRFASLAFIAACIAASSYISSKKTANKSNTE